MMPAALFAAPALNQATRFARTVARGAVRSLYAELTLYPKPGLVSLIDNGSHRDMDAATFLRSMFALRHYFRQITVAGSRAAQFGELASLGIAAERRMMAATGGINTHRGAIFALGMLCAAAGQAQARGLRTDPDQLRSILHECWGTSLAHHASRGAPLSHGRRAAQRYAVGGARDEAALGFPSVFQVALPAMRGTLKAGRGLIAARIDALFSVMAALDDTNVLHRGGAAGAVAVRAAAQRFLALGGTAHPAWKAEALECHRVFTACRLSPGGAADMLAAACLVQHLASL